VQRLAPVMTYSKTVDFSSGVTELFNAPASGAWSLANGRFAGTASNGVIALDLITVRPAPASLIELSSVLSVTASGGFVFDYYNQNAFKYVLLNKATGEVTLGHKTSKGWFTDAVYQNNLIKTSADQNLAITIKGTTVSVKWNNSLVISFVFNALVTDGKLGLLSNSGTTSFNEVKFQTDDAGLSTAGTTSTNSTFQKATTTTTVPPIESMKSDVSSPLATVIPMPAISNPAAPVAATKLPVMGSLLNDLIGTTTASALVSGFSGTGGTMIPRVTSNVSIDDNASVSSPLQAVATGAPVRLVGNATQSWTLSSVNFDPAALAVPTTGHVATEEQPSSADSAGETPDVSDGTQAVAANATVESVLDPRMMPPTSHGVVEPSKADEAQPDSDEGNEPGRPRPDAS